ncbi:MAG: hypothetical protein ACOZAK_03170 [Patescibacteria group bacterium]
MPITKEQLQYVALDDQGAGRCGIGEATLGSFLGKTGQDETTTPETEKTSQNLFANIMRAGINPPDSGRTELHPLVTDLIKKQFGIEFADKKIHLLRPDDVTGKSLVMVLSTDLDSVPAYVLTQAFDVLHAPIRDPFPNLEQDLGSAAAQIYFYAFLLAYVVENRFEELGTSRDEQGRIIPRNLLNFHPAEWEKEFFADIFGLATIKLPASGMTILLERRTTTEFDSLGKEPPENPGRSFFDDEWGEQSLLSKPGSFLGGRF